MLETQENHLGSPPLPSNWNKMTGDERYQHLAAGFVSTEGKPFATPEIAEKYRQRAQRYLDVVALKEPDEVPVVFMGDGFFLQNAGCPHYCIFCDQERSVNSSQAADADEISGRLDDVLPQQGDGEVAFYGGSFTMLAEDIQCVRPGTHSVPIRS